MAKKIDRKILLNPGPATTTDSVKMSQVVSDICPRENEFQKILLSIRKDLLRIVNASQTDYTSVLFGGSGTSAMEAVISSVIPSDSRLLILINGAYGKRMELIAKTYSIPYKTINLESGTSFDIKMIEKTLIEDSTIEYISMVHHETTTGMLNPIEAIQEMSEQYSKTLIVDSISSFAGIPLDMRKNSIDYIMSTSNKCIQGMAGISFIICNKEKLEKLSSIPPRSFYLSLYDQYRYLEDHGQTRFTPPVQTVYALRKAIDEFFKEGYQNRYERYTENWRVLRTGMEKLGFKFLLDTKEESHILTTIIQPDNKEFDFMKVHDLMYDKGFTIYPGKISKKTFRLATMGEIFPSDIKRFLNALSQVLTILGIKSVKYNEKN